jgi:hypothetical protein
MGVNKKATEFRRGVGAEEVRLANLVLNIES